MNRRQFFKTTTLMSAFAGIFGYALFSKTKPIELAKPWKPIAGSHVGKLNGRSIIDQIKRDLLLLSETVMFESNTNEVRKKFNASVENRLNEKYVINGLIQSFILINDETINSPSIIDNNIMKAQLWIKLTNTVEWTILDFAVSPMLS